MKNYKITDLLFTQAIEAIDSGNITVLESLITRHPWLVSERFKSTEEGYFKDPYLIWFVADNPIRNDKLPPNIVEITRLLTEVVKREGGESVQHQLDYTLGLVATGKIPRECGVQIEMIDLLIDEGAIPGGGLGAVAHGNIEAAKHLIKRGGGKLTLAAAVCFDQKDDVARLLPDADKGEQLAALTAAGFYGKTGMISFLLKNGVDPNGYPNSNSGFHSHATPLHQAVSSGSLDAVKLLIEAGAKLDAKDKVYGGTPLGWALYMEKEESFDEVTKKKFALIAEYFQSKDEG